MNYKEFLTGLNLRHFNAEEFTSYQFASRNGVRNALPPRELWENIVPTAWLLDMLRAHLQKPIVLTSTYRSTMYNQAVGGTSRSLHKDNRAIDFQARGASPDRCFSILKDWRSAGVFKGGLGLYRSFVHVDTRGYNATW